MACPKLKPIEERDPYAALVIDAFDRMENGRPMLGDEKTIFRNFNPPKIEPLPEKDLEKFIEYTRCCFV